MRCCSDEFVTRGATGELQERGAASSVYHAMEVEGQAAPGLPYGAPEDSLTEPQAEAMRAAAVAAMYPDDYADDESGAGGGVCSTISITRQIATHPLHNRDKALKVAMDVGECILQTIRKLSIEVGHLLNFTSES